MFFWLIVRTLWIRRMSPLRTPNCTRRCSSMRSECGLKRRQRSRIVVPWVMPLFFRRLLSSATFNQIVSCQFNFYRCYRSSVLWVNSLSQVLPVHVEHVPEWWWVPLCAMLGGLVFDLCFQLLIVSLTWLGYECCAFLAQLRVDGELSQLAGACVHVAVLEDRDQLDYSVISVGQVLHVMSQLRMRGKFKFTVDSGCTLSPDCCRRRPRWRSWRCGSGRRCRAWSVGWFWGVDSVIICERVFNRFCHQHLLGSQIPIVLPAHSEIGSEDRHVIVQYRGRFRSHLHHLQVQCWGTD